MLRNSRVLLVSFVLIAGCGAREMGLSGEATSNVDTRAVPSPG